MSDPSRLEGQVRRELDRLGPGGRIGDVVTVWPDAVGEAIAANAWPARIARDGTLHVATSSSAWAFELTQLAGSVREKLSERLGEAAPASIRFAAGRLPERGPKGVTTVSRTVPIPSREVLNRAAEMAADVQDPTLRAAISRAAAASLAVAEAGSSDRPFC
jgi:predicted nucleic acid-binding Zn ribbon protein